MDNRAVAHATVDTPHSGEWTDEGQPGSVNDATMGSAVALVPGDGDDGKGFPDRPQGSSRRSASVCHDAPNNVRALHRSMLDAR